MGKGRGTVIKCNSIRIIREIAKKSDTQLFLYNSIEYLYTTLHRSIFIITDKQNNIYRAYRAYTGHILRKT